MPLVSSAAAAMQRSRQVHVNGRDYTLAEYVGAAPKHGVYVHGNEVNDNGLPQGFLVIQPDEGAYRVVAGQAGLDLLVLQFPRVAQTSLASAPAASIR